MPNPKPKKSPNLWKKGQTGNPKGSSRRQKEYGEVRRLSHEQIAEVGALLLNGGIDSLKALLGKDSKATTLQSWTAALIIKSMNKGDSATYERLLNRIVGRVPENLHLSGADGGPIQHVQTMEQMEAQLAAIRLSRKEMGDD